MSAEISVVRVHHHGVFEVFGCERALEWKINRFDDDDEGWTKAKVKNKQSWRP